MVYVLFFLFFIIPLKTLTMSADFAHDDNHALSVLQKEMVTDIVTDINVALCMVEKLCKFPLISEDEICYYCAGYIGCLQKKAVLDVHDIDILKKCCQLQIHLCVLGMSKDVLNNKTTCFWHPQWPKGGYLNEEIRNMHIKRYHLVKYNPVVHRTYLCLYCTQKRFATGKLASEKCFWQTKTLLKTHQYFEHERIETNTNDYLQKCGNKFSRMTTLGKHLRNYHFKKKSN